MAVLQGFATKTVLGNTDLELKADPGEAFRVWDIMIDNPASNYITLKTEKTTVGYFRVGTGLGSHLHFPKGKHEHVHKIRLDPTEITPIGETVRMLDEGDNLINALMGVKDAISVKTDYYAVNMAPGYRAPKTILSYLREKGVFTGYPVAEGEAFRITGAKQANAVQMVIYEILEPGDIKPDDENGSKSLEYLLVNYGHTGANIAAAGDFEIGTTVNPAEFPAFPYGKVVPAQHEISILGILASDYGPTENLDTCWIRTKYLKLIKDREVLFDEDRNGLLMLGVSGTAPGGQSQTALGVSLCGNYSHKDAREPFWLPEPLVCLPGDELLLYWTMEIGATSPPLDTNMQVVGLIEKIRRLK